MPGPGWAGSPCMWSPRSWGPPRTSASPPRRSATRSAARARAAPPAAAPPPTRCRDIRVKDRAVHFKTIRNKYVTLLTDLFNFAITTDTTFWDVLLEWCCTQYDARHLVASWHRSRMQGISILVPISSLQCGKETQLTNCSGSSCPCPVLGSDVDLESEHI